MIIATRLSAVWQVAGVAAAALCCYLVSQSVAAERAGLDKVDRQIAQTHDDIAKLHTEIGVRGRMGQLERWNTEVLALQAPRPSQFVADGIQLASLYGRKGQPALALDPAIVAQQGAVNKVAYTASAPQPVRPAATAGTAGDMTPAPQPLLRPATYVRPAPDRLASAPAAPLMEKASYQPPQPVALKPDAPQLALKPAMPKPAPLKPALAKSVAPTAPKAVATKVVEPKAVADARPAVAKATPRHASTALLPDDIGQLAARERGGKDSSKAAR